MSRLTFQLGTEIEQKPTVLTWRLPKRQITCERPEPQRETLKNASPVFGRRKVPPVG